MLSQKVRVTTWINYLSNFELRVSGYPIKSRGSGTNCRTEGQWKLLHLLKEQLEEMGLINVTLSEKGTLMATLPANVPGDIPAIGFISHVDTSPDCSGKNVNPQIVENYRGGDIALGIGDEVLSPVMFPVLRLYWVRR